MDPITVAGAYATIVGLMCAFKNQKKGREDQTRDQFLSWLEAQYREDLKEFILRTADLPSEIDRLLKEDTEGYPSETQRPAGFGRLAPQPHRRCQGTHSISRASIRTDRDASTLDRRGGACGTPD